VIEVIFMGQTPFLSPNQQCQRTKDTESVDTNYRKPPHAFFICHKTFKGSDTALFTLIGQ